MKNKFLNKEQSEKIFREGFVEYNFSEMVGFARYAFTQKWSRERIEKAIRVKFFEKGLNLVLLREQIHKAALMSKMEFLEQDKVIITKGEIDKIKSLPNRRSQLSVFGILVYAKKLGVWSKNKLYFWGDLKESLRNTGIFMSNKEYNDFLTFVGKDKRLILANINKKKLSWKVLVAEEDTHENFYLEITDFAKVQKYLPFFCQECKKEMRLGKYCDEHKSMHGI